MEKNENLEFHIFSSFKNVEFWIFSLLLLKHKLSSHYLEKSISLSH